MDVGGEDQNGLGTVLDSGRQLHHRAGWIQPQHQGKQSAGVGLKTQRSLPAAFGEVSNGIVGIGILMVSLSGNATRGVSGTAHSAPPSLRNDFSSTVRAA